MSPLKKLQNEFFEELLKESMKNASEKSLEKFPYPLKKLPEETLKTIKIPQKPQRCRHFGRIVEGILKRIPEGSRCNYQKDPWNDLQKNLSNILVLFLFLLQFFTIDSGPHTFYST